MFMLGLDAAGFAGSAARFSVRVQPPTVPERTMPCDTVIVLPRAGGVAVRMIVGTGVDIVDVARVAAAMERFGERFAQRVFTPDELGYCRSKKNVNERLAARFAAKEAAMKALGTGWRHGIAWRDFEVCRQPGGRPVMQLAGKAAEFAARQGVKRIALSLTHTETQAMAFVIFEGE
jgi:holo-[acyl-carrier protein] synthase